MWNFNKQNEIQLLAKFKKILYMGFRATLPFRKFMVALNPMYRIFLNFAKSCTLSCLSKFHNKKNLTVPFLKYKRLKLKLRVFLAGHSVAMVTYCVTKIIFSIPFFHFISLKKRKYNDNPAQPADSKANRGGLHF